MNWQAIRVESKLLILPKRAAKFTVNQLNCRPIKMEYECE